jgi:hypothetical protein
MAFNADVIRWTEDISLREFVEKYKNHLPKLIRTTSGFSNAVSINDVGSDEVSFEKARMRKIAGLR